MCTHKSNFHFIFIFDEEIYLSSSFIPSYFRPEVNGIEAYANGAWEGAKIYIHVIANLIAFVAALNFINATLAWFGARIGVPDLSFEVNTIFLCHVYEF